MAGARKVFISYSHDDGAHEARVLQLADTLRDDGVDCRLDQYVSPAPATGWRTWMEDQLEEADVVLVACTKTYLRRQRKREEAGKGAGATWEGAIIAQSLYDAHLENTKFFPVVFVAGDKAHVPVFLRDFAIFTVDTPAGYDDLYFAITGQPKVVARPLGPAKTRAPLRTERLFASPGASPSNLPPLSSHVIERPDELAAIHAALVHDGPVGIVRSAAVTADGGYGKTMAALLYAHQHAADFPGGRFFIRCEQGSIASELAGLSRWLGVDPELKDDEKAVAVKAALESGAPSLVILDNVAGEQQWTDPAFRSLVPGGSARLLITTRSRDLSNVTDVKIGRLTPEQGVELLARFRADAREAANLPAVRDLVEQVEGLAVAVASAGAYMKLTRQATWPASAAELRKGSLGVFDRAEPRVASQVGYARTVVKVLDAAVDALPPPERRVMEYAALLPADLAPRPWLTSLLEQDATVSLARKPGVELSPAEAVVARLVDLDLLHPSAQDTRLMSVHRAHRARLAERLAADEPRRSVLLDALAAVGETRGSASRDADADRSLRWEIAPLAGLSIALDDVGRTKAAVSVANWVGVTMGLLGQHSAVRLLLERYAGDEARTRAAAGEQELATLLSHLGWILQKLGDLPAARVRMERAIEIGEKHFDADHPTLATRYSNLAGILQDHGDLPAARASIERAIAIEEKHFGADHPTLAISYSNLAMILQDQGDLTAARARMERAIAILEKHFDADHPKLATSYSNLAGILRAEGDLPASRASIERAIAIEEKLFDADHPDLAIRYNNLSWILWDMNERAAAVDVQERANAILRKHFGPEHPDRQASDKALATMRARLGG